MFNPDKVIKTYQVTMTFPTNLFEGMTLEKLRQNLHDHMGFNIPGDFDCDPKLLEITFTETSNGEHN